MMLRPFIYSTVWVQKALFRTPSCHNFFFSFNQGKEENNKTHSVYKYIGNRIYTNLMPSKNISSSIKIKHWFGAMPIDSQKTMH